MLPQTRRCCRTSRASAIKHRSRRLGREESWLFGGLNCRGIGLPSRFPCFTVTYLPRAVLVFVLALIATNRFNQRFAAFVLSFVPYIDMIIVYIYDIYMNGLFRSFFFNFSTLQQQQQYHLPTSSKIGNHRRARLVARQYLVANVATKH